MSHPFVIRSTHRPVVLFAFVFTLAACGGGGDAADPGAGSATVAPASGPLTYAECTQNPTGVTNVYLNSFRPKREWTNANFLGESVTARREYASTSAATPVRVWYYKYDASANTVTTVGHEDLDVNGNVTRREQFAGLVNSRALSAGQSETVDYTVKTLLPTGQPDTTERLTLTYERNENITLPGGRLDTCRVKSVIERIAGGASEQVSVETLYLAPGFGFVKSYYKPTLASFSDRNQTYLTELVSTNGTLSLAAPTASAAPTLAQCSALPAGQSLVMTASTVGEANNALRSTSNSTFNGTAALAVERRNVVNDARSQIDYYDPSIGLLRYIAVNAYGSSGSALVTSVVRSGRPNLLGTAPLATVAYTETFLDTVGGGTTSSSDTFTFEGYAKITTPAGTFDTCKVRFSRQGGVVETYYHAPNLYWVRQDITDQSGVRTTRELISHN